jgi:hypothetical protein
MKAVSLCLTMFCLIIVMTPSMSASVTAIDAARRACKRHLGGTAEFVSVDRDQGYILCRDPKDRRTVRLPFRSARSKATTASEGSGPAAPTVQPLPSPDIVTAPVPPVSGSNCLTCTEKPTPQEPAPTQLEIPQQNGGTTESPPSSGGQVTVPGKEDAQKAYDRGLLEQAHNICVKQYGPMSKVDHIDDRTWAVVCTKP